MASTETTNITESNISEKNSKRILQICNELYVGLSVDKEEVQIRKFENGFANNIFRVDFHTSARPSLPSVVIKFYDLTHEQLFSVTTSQLNNLIVGQSGLGPRIHQIHPDALIMQYLPARPLTPADDHQLHIRTEIARKLAHFHSLSVPIGRNQHQNRVLKIFNNRLDERLLESMEGGPIKETCKLNSLKNLLEHDLHADAEFVRDSILRDESHAIVFCHCDFNHGNILLTGDDEEVKFIDFDYSMYFYRGTDFGRYFLDCTQTEQFNDSDIVADSLMRHFIESYREASGRIHGRDYLSNPLNSVEALLWEAKLMVLFAYLVDVIFLVRMASFCKTEEKRAMFLFQADKRFGGYLKTKKRFQTEYVKKKPEQ